MLVVPGARFGWSVATAVELRTAEPMVVVPAEKVTVPVGVGPLVPSTVASRSTTALGPLVEAAPRAVTVGMVPTTWLIAGDVRA